MADVSAEDIAHLEQLAATLQRRLRVLEMQAAGFGALAVPAHIVLNLEDTRRELTRTLADLRRLRPGHITEQSPYLGLLTFQETNADLFFGRDALVADLVERARRSPFLAVLGASGSGKSSVVRAGLIPMLKGGALVGSESWRYITLKPGARPLDALAAELAKLQNGDLSLALTLSHQLAESDRALLLAADMLLDRAAGQRLVLVVDQFEELWTLAPAEGEPRAVFLAQQQRPFLQLLLTALTAPDTPLLIVVAMRADFLHRAADDPALAHAIGEHDLIVSPMTPAELRDAIVRPATLLDGDFEPGLVDELIAQVTGRPGALPLLEYTLAELWKKREPNGMMTWETYRRLGGVEGALAARADAILSERYTTAQQEELRQVLLRLVQPGEGVADTRRRVRLDDLVLVGESPESLYALLKPLIDERLLTSGRESANDTETLEVSHEALIRAWPTLRRWIDEARADLRFQLQLEEAAQEWQENAENPDLVWRGLRLSNAEAWRKRAQPRLNARDQAFLDASRAAEQARTDAEDAARQRELTQAQVLAERQQRLAEAERQRAEEQTKASQRLRQRAVLLVGALVVALVAAVGAGWFGIAAQRSAAAEQAQKATAVAASRQAEHAANLAIARQLVMQAERDITTQLERALLFSVEANQLADEAQTRGILLSMLVANERLIGFMPAAHTSNVDSVAFSSDGKTLASASWDQTIRLWDVATRQPLGDPLRGHSDAVRSVAFSPDGTTLASASSDQTIRLWDVATGQPRGDLLRGHSDAVWSVAFSPDGKILASASDDQTIRLWDVATRQPLGDPLRGHSDAVWSVAFSPDGKILASASWDQTIRLWDVATRQPRGDPLRGHTSFVNSVAFSPDGTTLASASLDQTIRLWDVATRQPLDDPLRGHSDGVNSVAFSPDGTTLASASSDQTIRLWEVATRQPRGDLLRGHSDAVRSVAFSPDGTTLASASSDHTVPLWDVATRQPLGDPLRGHSDAVRSVAFSPDGKTLASASLDHTIRLWDVVTRQPLGDPLKGHTSAVYSVAFSPDGKTLASASADQTIRLWGVATRQPLADPLKGDTTAVSVAFSPDSKILASASYGQIRLWDVATRQPLGDPLRGHTDFVLSVAFSPDGTTLASGSWDQTVRLWDVATRQPLGDPLRGHTSFVNSVAFSPDGTTLASGSWDQTVRLWDVATRQPLGDSLRGHSDVVNSVAFSSDGKTLASAGNDTTIRLWDVATRQPLGDPLRVHTGAVMRVVPLRHPIDTVVSVAFSSDGKTLASASDDQTVQLWRMDTASWISRACQIVGRNLTQDEWSRFVSQDRPYHRTCSAFPPGEGVPTNTP